jgi:sulfur-oxidizing protein SoxZ
MSDIGKVRIRVPASVKRGEVVKVRCLVIHPMERVERGKDGKAIDKNYRFINRIVVQYLGREIAQFETTQSISENPFFSFAVRAVEPGPLTVTFFDTHGSKFEGAADIKVVA